jgi:transcriptional regulator of acetoin/glycerol metabolism
MVVTSRKKQKPAKPEPETLNEKIAAEPDLVDRIFDYIVEVLPDLKSRQSEIKRTLRQEFASERVYIRRLGTDVQSEVARLFNGRNATEVARELRISRATVYRLLKQAG